MPVARRVALLALIAALPAPARTQGSGWNPTAPVRVVVPQPPGGTMDLLARQLGQTLQADFGQPVVIENRTGAGTMIGTEAVARAAPDGHTVLIAANSLTINAALQPNAGYDPLRDFAPIALLTVVPHVLVAHPRVAADFAGFLAAARRTGAGLSFGSYGNGTSNHLGAEHLKMLAGLNATHVPYRGVQAYPDLHAGRIDFMFSNLPNVLQPAAAGQIRPLAIAAPRRSPHLPEVPTLAELGFPGLESDTFVGLWAPAGTPAHALARLAEAVGGVLRCPDMAERFRLAGIPVVADGPEGLSARVAREVPLWREVIRRVKIAAE